MHHLQCIQTCTATLELPCHSGKVHPYHCPESRRSTQRAQLRQKWLVCVDDAMPLVVWTRNYLQEQGFMVQDNVVYQDNHSAMKLEKNGKASSGHKTRHIDIWYFFINDGVKAAWGSQD